MATIRGQPEMFPAIGRKSRTGRWKENETIHKINETKSGRINLISYLGSKLAHNGRHKPEGSFQIPGIINVI
ncbi:hypothetical protein QE152_g12502 [Popillia japonica]|uniref:Ribosomal protein L2 n=1 Tax=Popillia japonica TaxID=7064 RepID=A0AAW1LRK0_POPJA